MNLDGLFANRTGHKRGCSICGGPNVVHIQVRVQTVNEKGTMQPLAEGGKANSRGRSFCAEHAVVVWPSVLSALEDAR